MLQRDAAFWQERATSSIPMLCRVASSIFGLETRQEFDARGLHELVVDDQLVRAGVVTILRSMRPGQVRAGLAGQLVQVAAVAVPTKV
jgi:hypothetical protein